MYLVINGKMNINDLPEEILAEIFSFIHNPTDVRKIGFVCYAWHKLVWGSRTYLNLRNFPEILEGNQLQYTLRLTRYTSFLQMPHETTDNHVCKIGCLLPYLKVLYLKRCRNITNAGMDYLSKRKLEKLYLSTSWNISTLDFLVGSTSSLTTLEIRGLDQLTDESFISLASKIEEPFFFLLDILMLEIVQD